MRKLAPTCLVAALLFDRLYVLDSACICVIALQGAEKECDGWQMGNLTSSGSSGKKAPPHTHCSFIKNGNLLNQPDKHKIASVAKTSGGGGGSFTHFGEWYSHPAMGECTGSHYVGDGSGCTWRAIGIQKAINASCMYAKIDKNIEDQDKPCFSQCSPPAGPTPSNPWADPKMTDCYLECYSNAVDRLSQKQLSAPWADAFEGADSCPAVEKICADGDTRKGCPQHR